MYPTSNTKHIPLSLASCFRGVRDSLPMIVIEFSNVLDIDAAAAVHELVTKDKVKTNDSLICARIKTNSQYFINDKVKALCILVCLVLYIYE